MATYDEELIRAARRLTARRKGQKGKLPSARVRRNISTSYYALFHFLVEEACLNIVGRTNDLRRRRRTLARLFTHAGIKTALEKARGPTVDSSVADLMRPAGVVGGAVQSPDFARRLAAAFSDAQAKRHDADYDLNKALTELDARLLASRVRRVIKTWRASGSIGDRDFKHALCILMMLKGRLRRDDS